MSTKINKNGKEFPVGVIPKNYPASNIKMANGESVEDAVNKGSKTVTASDSTHTQAYWLNQLASELDYSKVSCDTKLVVEGDIYICTSYSASSVSFSLISINNQLPYVVRIRVSSNSQWERINSGNYQDLSNSTITSGKVYKLIY